MSFTSLRAFRFVLVGAGCAITLAACATAPQPGSRPALSSGPAMAPETGGPVSFTAQPGLSPAQRGERAEALLMQGQLGLARAEVDSLLADAPQDPLGRSLYRQMNEEPRRLLPGEPVSHTVEAGETLPELAARYLGDRNLFWALARYNGVPVPSEIRPGQVLQIPRETHGGHGSRRSGPGPARGTAAAKPMTPAAPAAVRDPARSARLRGEGLAALSRGQADRAVGLLQAALRADPDSAAAKRDLERAERIRAQLHGRR